MQVLSRSWRPHTLRWLAMLALLAVATAAALPPRAAAQQPLTTFQAAECFVPAPDGYAMECGYVIAPESHNSFDGDVVALATAIVRSPNPNKAPDPVVFLAGGPGQAATPLAAVTGALFARVLQNRDVIFFDQRGAGYSQPGLFCPPLGVNTLRGRTPIGAFGEQQRPEIIDLQVAAYTACGQAYQQAGVDLTTYNSAENAADIEDLRRALGYNQINLFGGSYGTRLALEAMRFRPETIRSVVIDSVVPIQTEFQPLFPRSLDLALEGLFAACGADAACNATYPDLGAQWDALVARLNSAPIQLPIVNLDTGELIDYVPVNGWDLTHLVNVVLADTQAIPFVPALIGETAAGRYDLLATLYGLIFQPGGEPPPPQSGFAIMMYTATQCYDDAPFMTATDFIRIRDQHRRGQPLSTEVGINEAFLEVCANLGLGTATPAYADQPLQSDLPTFVIAGEIDPRTPAENAVTAAATLSRSTVVVYPRGGHTPSATSPCLANAVAAFIENPAATPDTSCIAAEAPLPFVTPESAQATLAHLTTDRSWVQRLR
jgi:pimeloyl-ACP methyl ester carboxylesterase